MSNKIFPAQKRFLPCFNGDNRRGSLQFIFSGKFLLTTPLTRNIQEEKNSRPDWTFLLYYRTSLPPSLPPPFPPPQIASTIQVTYEHDVRSSNTNKICLIFTIIFRWTNQKKLFQSEIDKFLADFSQKILTFIEFVLFSGKILTFNQNCFSDC